MTASSYNEPSADIGAAIDNFDVLLTAAVKLLVIIIETQEYIWHKKEI